MEQFLQNVRSFIADVQASNPLLLREAAESAISLVDRRVSETGITADGTQLGDYTDGVYKKKREDKGLTTSYVNLAFTNDMWGDVRLLTQNQTGNVAQIVVGAAQQENKDKLFYNSVRYDDDILEVSTEEEKQLNQIMDNGLQRIANKYF